MLWIILAVALALAVMAGLRLARGLYGLRVREAERRRRVAAHSEQRQRARRVLEGEVEPLQAPPVDLRSGELAYYRTAAAALRPESDGGFHRSGRGELLISNRAVYFVTAGGVEQRHPIQEVERVDIPYANVVALVSFRDTLTRDEQRIYFEVPAPLLLAAHVSRFTAFELVLS